MLRQGQYFDLEREMTPDEFSNFMWQRNMRQIDMAKFLDQTERTIRRYQHGDAAIPVPVALLLRLVDRHGYWLKFF
jgi:DNA-binding transcriptional regulator YiaG